MADNKSKTAKGKEEPDVNNDQLGENASEHLSAEYKNKGQKAKGKK